MAELAANTLMRQVRRLVGMPRLAGESDAALLNRFIGDREEAAFAALMERHGPMVLGVARRVLHDVQAAEDVVQATFLVLARQARSIRKVESLSSSLHGVAYRLARHSQAETVRRRQRESQVAVRAAVDPLAEITARELCHLLDEELTQLAEKLRQPLVLCYLEGHTRDDAARHLGWSLRTLARRLEQGRERLRGRLSRRGVALSAAFGVAALTGQSAKATLSRLLFHGTLTLVLNQAATPASLTLGVSPAVSSLVKAGLQNTSMFKISAWLLATALLVCAGASAGVMMDQAGPRSQINRSEEVANALAGDEAKPPPSPMPPRQLGADLLGDPLPPGALHRLGTLRFRNARSLTSIAFLPDGKRVVTASLMLYHIRPAKIAGRPRCPIL